MSQQTQQPNINLEQDIFAALIANHDVQRDLCDQLEKACANKDERKHAEQKAIYEALKKELKAHAAGEERHLYVPVMQHDKGLDLSRHAITEHHEMDEMMSTLDDGRISYDTWCDTCGKLIDEVRHHFKEEENEFFNDARKILDKNLQQRLGALYQIEHIEYIKNNF